MTAPSLRTCLWFADRAEEAARFYVSLLPGSQIVQVFPNRAAPETAFLVHLQLCGQSYTFMNGGPHYALTPAASIEVHLDTQAEVDRLWDALVEGGTPMRCGWLTDRFGVSWQIIPRILIDLMQTRDAAKAHRVTQAMMQMIKLDGAALEAAAGA